MSCASKENPSLSFPKGVLASIKAFQIAHRLRGKPAVSQSVMSTNFSLMDNNFNFFDTVIEFYDTSEKTHPIITTCYAILFIFAGKLFLS